jgi:DNA-binding response OmpR family regulator
MLKRMIAHQRISLATMTSNEHQTEFTALIVEDDKSVSQLIRLYLAQAGFRVLAAEDGLIGLDMALNQSPDIILLDLNLPGMDGIDVCSNVRKESAVPIIMVTARVEEDDRLTGLDLGADDYVSKPFSPRELVARVNAVLRRSSKAIEKREETGNKIDAGDVVIDLERRSTAVLGDEIELTPTEFRLLAYFIEGRGRTVSRDQIIENVFGYDFSGYDRTVDTHVSNLRKKLEVANPNKQHLKTMYGVGYRFDA